MSSYTFNSYLKHFHIPVAACISVLILSGCSILDKSDDNSKQSSKPEQETKSEPREQSVKATRANKGDPAKHSEHAVHPMDSANPDPSKKKVDTANKKDIPDDVLQGACTQSDREKHIHAGNHKFIEKLKACSRETWAKKEKNVACLAQSMPSLSKECACCFADMADCSLDNCKMACMRDSSSQKCKDCGNSNCQAALLKCSGVARTDLP